MSTDTAAHMVRLPDPRRYGPGAGGEPLLALAEAGETARAELRAACEDLLGREADAEFRRVLRLARSRETYSRLWEALCDAVERPRAAADEVIARLFAIPWIMVCGAREAAQVPGTVAQPEELARLLETHGAFGASRNLGLGSALCSFETLDALPASEVYRATRAAAPTRMLREVAPAPIALAAGSEAVHLRFLLGAAVAPAHAPSIVETAANIGVWGRALARALAAQLAVPGVQLLPVPRPPHALLRAGHAGRRAQLEIAFQLYMSNAVRRFRLVTGDPEMVISAHGPGAGAEMRVSLSSNLDDTAIEGFRWPLHPLDDLPGIVGHIRELARECRLAEPQVPEQILPDRTARGALFLRAADAAC